MINTQENMSASVAQSAQFASVNNFDAHKLTSLKNEIIVPSVVQSVDATASDITSAADEISTLIECVELLEQKHNNYVEQFINRGNLALYSLLSQIYELALNIEMSKHKDEMLSSLRNELTLRKNIRTQKNSSAMSMIVRWIVGASRQLAYSYSKALEAARQDNIAAKDIVSYFSNGGLNKSKKKQEEQGEVKVSFRAKEFNNFMRSANVFSDVFQNTEIKWTEEVFMENKSGHSVILGRNSGGGSIQGFRAFNLSDEAYIKICKILADEMFNEMREDKVIEWVQSDTSKCMYKKEQLKLIEQSVV